MKEIMVRMDDQTHSILKKWKKKLAEHGIKVSLGAAVREIEKLIKNESVGFSKKDIMEINHAMEKMKEISEKYNNPTFSDVIVTMDSMIKYQDQDKGFDYMKGRYDGD